MYYNRVGVCNKAGRSPHNAMHAATGAQASVSLRPAPRRDKGGTKGPRQGAQFDHGPMRLLRRCAVPYLAACKPALTDGRMPPVPCIALLGSRHTAPPSPCVNAVLYLRGAPPSPTCSVRRVPRLGLVGRRVCMLRPGRAVAAHAYWLQGS